MGVDKAIFTPVKSRRAFEEVSSKIKTLVFEGALTPGDKLPSETELATQFNVGRQTVREALRILELSGFITVQKGYGGGSIVQDTILSQISNLFSDAFQMEKITLEQITTARIAIERAILEHAIDNADLGDLRALEDNLARAQKKADQGMMCIEENIEFHKLLAEASKNPVFVVVAESVLAIMRGLTGQLPPDPETCKKAIINHNGILQGIKGKNFKKAISSLERDFLDLQNRLESQTGQGTTEVDG
ncbi:FadR/GntR family transcriptional regulator [Thermodesulfobacteriota bacterium]